jgi:hypothetical protein
MPKVVSLQLHRILLGSVIFGVDIFLRSDGGSTLPHASMN